MTSDNRKPWVLTCVQYRPLSVGMWQYRPLNCDMWRPISTPECWHVTINIHPQVVPCDNIHSWVVTCDNIHPWDRLSFRVPAPAAWPGAKRPSLGLFLSSARLKICPAAGHWLSPCRAATSGDCGHIMAVFMRCCDGLDHEFAACEQLYKIITVLTFLFLSRSVQWKYLCPDARGK